MDFGDSGTFLTWYMDENIFWIKIDSRGVYGRFRGILKGG